METEVIKLKKPSPEEVVVVNGESWKCPVYVRRMPPCRSSCPTSEDIRGYLTVVAQSMDNKTPVDEALDEAWYTLTDKNPFPAIHGRICPHPCEGGCNRLYKDGSVAINSFERVVGDHGLKRGLKLRMLTDKKRDKKIAIMGAGPSGMSCAYQLARRGYKVTVFEAAKQSGGMLRYGIPKYRLPREILDAEMQRVLNLGVELRCDTKVGVDIPFPQLKKEYDAIYVAVGAQKGGKLGIPGEDIPNVIRGVDFLHKINSGENVAIGKKAVVVGGGNTAIDAARVSRRLGADVTLLYRRTKSEMPAIKEEIAAAEAEGVQFHFLAAPVSAEVKGGKANGAVSLKCIKMKLGEKDKSGRSRPVPIDGSGFTVEADTVLSAVGQEPDLEGMTELANKHSWIDANAARETSIPGVYAGGDVVGVDIAVTAVGHGRKAARAIDAFLHDRTYREPSAPRPIKHTEMKLDYYKEAPRNDAEELAPEKRIGGFEEIHKTLTTEQAIAESKRCMSCGLCFTCDRCRVFCPREAISRDKSQLVGQKMFSDYTRCFGCHICAEACPSGYIEMGMGL